MPKFELGQKVYAVTPKFKKIEKHRLCNICDSTGVVEIKGNQYTCPHCNGRIEVIQEGFEYIIAYKEALIGKIDIQLYAVGYGYESEIRYMLRETGVGTGRVWHEDRLFATEAEAQEFCDKYVPLDHYDCDEPILK